MSWVVRYSLALCMGFGLMLAPAAFAQNAPKKDDKAKKQDGKKKSDDKDEKKDKDEKEEKPYLIGALVGQVKRMVTTDEEGTTVFLEVTTISPQLQVFSRQPQTGYSLYRRNSLSGRDYRGYIVPREVKQEFRIDLAELTKIRIPPKPELDENGKVIRKPPVIKRDKNDPEYGLPGVKGEVTDLNRGQLLRVTLGTIKDPTDPKGQKRMIVATMVEMLYDPAQAQQQPPGKP